MLRLLGDNGKLNDNMLMHVLSPYLAHRSALTDCEKLVRSGMPGRKAIVIFGFDYDDWPMDPAIEAFETLASQRVAQGDQHVAAYDSRCTRSTCAGECSPGRSGSGRAQAPRAEAGHRLQRTAAGQAADTRCGKRHEHRCPGQDADPDGRTSR